MIKSSTTPMMHMYLEQIHSMLQGQLHLKSNLSVGIKLQVM